MRVFIQVNPGYRLVASCAFMTELPLFVSLVGPVAMTFASTWPAKVKRIENRTADRWQLSVHAGRGGPLGSDVPVRLLYHTGSVLLIAAGEEGRDPEALLTCTVTPV